MKSVRIYHSILNVRKRCFRLVTSVGKEIEPKNRNKCYFENTIQIVIVEMVGFVGSQFNTMQTQTPLINY